VAWSSAVRPLLLESAKTTVVEVTRIDSGILDYAMQSQDLVLAWTKSAIESQARPYDGG
jgi:hypothetical protein